jgi:DNA-directed RNA polymerase specialized sigma24 family protein
MTEPAAEALLNARRHAGLAEQARLAMLEHAKARRTAILAAHQTGMSIRRIAEELGCSPTVVQAALRLARGETDR